jgi:copper homeostasis protein
MSKALGRIVLEVCVGSITDIESAIAAGADRVELCSAPELGGLTPSIGLVEAALAIAQVPMIVMLRPRAGGFCYDPHEFSGMLRDAVRFLDLGASGIAFGVLDDRGNVDVARARELVQRAGPRDSVFHRAYDFVRQQCTAMDELIHVGCRRILSSGGKPSAKEGASTIRELIRHAKDQIEVLPAGGIRAKNIVDLVRSTGCSQVHLGPAAAINDGSITGDTGIDLCDARFMRGYAHRVVDGNAVAATVKALHLQELHPPNNGSRSEDNV